MLNIPKTYDFGFGEVVEVKYLETTFGITHRVALLYLKALRIKPLYIEDKTFFSLPTFKKIMYVLSRPGSPGFIFPGSKIKRNHYERKLGKYITEVTDAILKEAASPRIMGEMIASEGRDPSMIKKLLTHPPQKEVKK
jgi:hypothetical protein